LRDISFIHAFIKSWNCPDEYRREKIISLKHLSGETYEKIKEIEKDNSPVVGANLTFLRNYIEKIKSK
jgi:hypothetical protein